MSKEPSDFHTFTGYRMTSRQELTPAMEDYLEMIYRLYHQQQKIRIGDLSRHLNVQPSSTTKIVQRLKQFGYVDFEKYGDIALTDKGILEGEYLLYRHEILHRFLCVLNHSDDELEQVEKIEHFMDRKTILEIEKLTQLLQNDPHYQNNL